MVNLDLGQLLTKGLQMRIVRIIKSKNCTEAIVVIQDSEESTETIMRQNGFDDWRYDFSSIIELKVLSGSHPLVHMITSA